MENNELSTTRTSPKQQQQHPKLHVISRRNKRESPELYTKHHHQQIPSHNSQNPSEPRTFPNPNCSRLIPGGRRPSSSPENADALQRSRAAQNDPTPLETLQRLFPLQQKNTLELVLHGCNGDALKAINQLISAKNPTGHTQPPPSETAKGTADMPVSRHWSDSTNSRHSRPAPAFPVKSAFSPFPGHPFGQSDNLPGGFFTGHPPFFIPPAAHFHAAYGGAGMAMAAAAAATANGNTRPGIIWQPYSFLPMSNGGGDPERGFSGGGSERTSTSRTSSSSVNDADMDV